VAYGEGYELFTCPDCRHNVYDPATTCTNCGYPKNRKPAAAVRRDQSLLALARRDDRSNASPALRQLIHTMPRPNGRSFDAWRTRLESTLSAIVQRPVERITSGDGRKALRDLHLLMITRGVNDERLTAFYTACSGVLAAVEAQQAPAIKTPRLAPKRRRRDPHLYNSKRRKELGLKTWEQIKAAENTLIQRLMQALQTRELIPFTKTDLDEPKGVLLAQLVIPDTADRLTLRGMVDQKLARLVRWQSGWRHDHTTAAERRFSMHGPRYSLILKHDENTAYLIRLE